MEGSGSVQIFADQGGQKNTAPTDLEHWARVSKISLYFTVGYSDYYYDFLNDRGFTVMQVWK